MKILIIGAQGQLGKDCSALLASHHDISCCDMPKVDITHQEQLSQLFAACKPQVVINCAAYTAVDACETDCLRATQVNAKGPENLAHECAAHACRFIHISTDYVFDGKRPAPAPYVESDPCNPLSVYGTSKLAGETAIQNTLENHLILRTAWLYGIGNKNFLKTMLRLALTDPDRTFRVVNDQFGSLTWSWRLAEQIQAVLETNLTGIAHATAEGYSTWYEGAKCFLQAMQVPFSMEPCTTEEYPTPAHRPANSILENKRLKDAGLNVMAHWQEDVCRFAEQYKEELLREARG